MKKAKKVLSLCIAIVLLLPSLVVSSYAAEGDYEFCCDLEDTRLWRLFSDRLLYDTVNGAEYIYIVEDGEAAILNVQINYWGPEKISFTFPETLGGYPVTRIGYSSKDVYGIDVFHYIKYGDDYVSEDADDFAEVDPSLYYISEIIIPEGYKYIESNAFYLISSYKISFPKSLRAINGQAFDLNTYTHVDENGKKCTVLPECYVDTESREAYKGSITLPSRIVENSADWLYLLRSGPNLYVPSNISTKDFYNALYYYEAAAGDAGEIWPRRDADCTIHCAPDSEFLSVFEEYGVHPYATIITDVTPAEYIEFPEETVNVQVGDVVDLEAKTYPAEAVWTACDYTVSDPSIVQIDDYSGRITALKEGTVTVTATHCERGFVDTCTVNVTTEPEPVSGITEIKPATDTPYYSYGNRDYKLELTGSPSKIQLIRQNGSTTTIDRSKAQITSNGETETWVVNMCVEAGEHAVRAKYGKVWDETSVPFTVTYDVLDPVYGVNEIRPATDAPYYSYGSREYILDVAGSPSKIQVVCNNGSTITVDRSIAQITSNGETETWVVNMRVGAGEHAVRAKYGKVWADKLTSFTVTYDTPKAYSFNLTYENGIGTFDVVTDPQISKVQFALDNGCTLTYSQSVSYIGEDGLRHWTMTRKIATGRTFTLRTKLGNVWTNTDFEVNTII